MKKLYTLILFCNLSFIATAQLGTISSPFTSLGQSRNVSSAGIYYFNIGGISFSSYVDASGWVLVANDYATSVGSIPTTPSVSNTVRNILNVTSLSALSSATETRISTSTGNIDVVSTNATLLNRIVNNTTLNLGINDNSINNAWSGNGSVYLNGPSGCISSAGSALQDNIFHPCGDGNGFHWISTANHHREFWSNGESAAGTAFMLWVRAPLVLLPLPTLTNFTATKNNETVFLQWTTTFDSPSKYFEIEYSANGISFNKIGKVDANNSQNYTFNNINLLGKSFYRLKIVDIDGTFGYSKIISMISNGGGNIVLLYPNPVKELINIAVTSSNNFLTANLITTTGKIVNKTILKNGYNSIIVSSLASGIYFLQVENNMYKIIKE